MPDPATRDAVLAYADACRARVPDFTARHFGSGRQLRLHREALGLDLLRAPQRAPGRTRPVPAAARRALPPDRPDAASAAGWRAVTCSSRLVCRATSPISSSTSCSRHGRPPAAWRDRARRLIAEYVAARHAVAEFAACFVLLAIGLAPAAGPDAKRHLARADARAGDGAVGRRSTASGSARGSATLVRLVPGRASGTELVGDHARRHGRLRAAGHLHRPAHRPAAAALRPAPAPAEPARGHARARGSGRRTPASSCRTPTSPAPPTLSTCC